MTTQPPREFDLSPHPRILPMLGEINLEQWRCIAELIDNAIDAFLAAQRAGVPVANPEVHVTVPTTPLAGSRLVVRDNGPGMDATTLENAVKAGWTSNNPVSSLGMFGMGFNIATARLGRVTRVWTTRRGDREWCGVEIDFDALQAQRHFRTPILSRPKDDPHECGTEVCIERLKPEQLQWFASAANRTKANNAIRRAYSSMLRANGKPISFRLYLNTVQARPRNHCIWGGDGNPPRTMTMPRYGVIDAFQAIDVSLPDRRYCAKCWQWLGDVGPCPECESEAHVVRRTRRVYGWLGIQRYLSGTDFGTDFVRHGRKIEVGNRDLFKWMGGEVEEVEYPIDDPRFRGRIVGEVHLDHCRVTYTKDRFDRNDPAWEEMVKIVRGDGPLRPDKAEQGGFAPQSTPLYLLFQAFRRSSPKSKQGGAYAKLLVVKDNERAEEMAKHFYAGEPEYQTDAKWWALVEEADRELLNPPADGPGGGPGSIPDFPDGGPQPGPGPQPPGGPPPVPEPPREPIATLTREYRDEVTNQRWNVQAFRVEPGHQLLGADQRRPWALKALPSGVHEFYVDVAHAVFRSATMTPLDGLLAELAWSAMDFARGAQDVTATYGAVLAGLRDRYGTTNKLDPETLSGEARSTLNAIARSLTRNIASGDGRALFGELTMTEQEAIQTKMATRAVTNPQQVIDQGGFLEFAPRMTQFSFVRDHPELFFDGRYWDAKYETLDYGPAAATEEARARTLGQYLSLLSDAVWLAESDPGDLAAHSRARVLRASLALELLAPTAERETDS